MSNPAYLASLDLSAQPVDYEWDTVIFNTIWSTNDETSPRLSEAVNALGTRAAFALTTACAEWVVARVQGHVDTRDAELRVEAAWAAVLDPRYAKLTPPPQSPATLPKQYASPLRLAMKILAYAHELYLQGEARVHSMAAAQVLLVDHIVGRHPAVEPWLSRVLRLLREHAGDSGLTPLEEPPVPRELFEPGFVWTDDTARASLESFVGTLDPSSNPYLCAPSEMKAAGFTGAPYGRSFDGG